MKFGIHGPADITKIERAVRAEQLGYDMISFGDSPMIWSELFSTMALSAQATKKIAIGSGVSIVGTRIAPVVANGIATVNQIAPGRVFVGIGTGATSYALLGHDSPVKHAQFAAFARTVRGLLAGEEVDYDFNQAVKPVKFLMPDRGYVNTEHHVPMYLAAMGPKGQELAGEIADGVFDGWGPVVGIESLWERIKVGGQRSGRSLDNFVVFGQNSIVVLDPGEDINSGRVLEEAGVGVALFGSCDTSVGC